MDFTNFTWPTGVKQDRGLNISFTKDIILPPGASAGGQDGAVVLSFKDNKNAYRWELIRFVSSADCIEDATAPQ